MIETTELNKEALIRLGVGRVGRPKEYLDICLAYELG